MGCHREAEMIEQQMKAKQAGGSSGPVQQQQPQQQQQSQQQTGGAGAGGADYSAQWAEYYRSVGKIEEAEAIEKTLKNKVGGKPSFLYNIIYIIITLAAERIWWPEQYAESQPGRLRPAAAQSRCGGGGSSCCCSGGRWLWPEHDAHSVCTVFAVLCSCCCSWWSAPGSASARRRAERWSAGQLSWQLSGRWLRRLSRCAGPTAAEIAQKRQSLRSFGCIGIVGRGKEVYVGVEANAEVEDAAGWGRCRCLEWGEF